MKRNNSLRCAPKTPSLARIFGFILMSAGLVSPPQAWGQDSKTDAPSALRESDVIRLALDHAPGARTADAQEKVAAASVLGAGLPSNPSLVWARESVNTGSTGARGSQDLLGLSVPIEVARPRAAHTFARSQGAWTRAESALARNDIVLEAVLSYYDVSEATIRVEILSTTVVNLDEATQILERREATGAASGYERARLAIESELSRSRLAQAETRRQSEMVRLAALLGRRLETMEVVADLKLMADGQENKLAGTNVQTRESLQLAQQSETLAARATRDARLTWFPRIELAGGLKRANAEGLTGHGYFLGLDLDIPVFDRGQGDRSRAAAQRVLAVARTEALSRRIDMERQSALITFRKAREELERFETVTSTHVEQLLRAVQSGYQEGQRTIVELVDAQRAQTDVALWRLELLSSAKRAEVRLRSAAGELK